MTTDYVGSGGNNANAGTSWALRKETLNGAEDIPVAAGDTVIVGPGVYRETLTCDVSGSSGNPITYIADVTGRLTEGAGGIVRITGSDNDTTTTRGDGIAATSKNYRTFRGFHIDGCEEGIEGTICSDWIIEGCVIQGGICVRFNGTGTANTIRRCRFVGGFKGTAAVHFIHSATVDDAGHVVENCTFQQGPRASIGSTRIGGITVNRCGLTARSPARRCLGQWKTE